MARLFSMIHFLALITLLCLPLISMAEQQEKDGSLSNQYLDLSRPIDKTMRRTGNIVFEDNPMGGGVKWPFVVLKEEKSGETHKYKIETYDETCRSEIRRCAGGERVDIKGELHEGDIPFIVARTLRVVAEDRRATFTGAVFIRDRSTPALGEAWRDPAGTIWGDKVTEGDLIEGGMYFTDASRYCKSIGAQLPIREDYVRLREYMGARPGSHEGYAPQVLPNLDISDPTLTNWFWSVHRNNSRYAYNFSGAYGNIFNFNHVGGYTDVCAVRCVVMRH